MAGIENHDDGGVFATLALVDGAGVGEGKLVHFVALVFHGLVFKEYSYLVRVLADSVNDSRVAVEDVLVVVVADLHHAVAFTPADSGDSVAFHSGPCRGPFRVENVLQKGVQFERAERSLAHRGEQLHFGFEVDVDFAADAANEQFPDNLPCLLRCFEGDKVEVRPVDRRWRNSLVDFGGLVGDVVAAGLPKDVLQADVRDSRALEQIVEHVARAHARQLVRITDEYNAGSQRCRFENGCGKPCIDHAEFVDDEQIAFQLVANIFVELARDGVHLEQAVDGAGVFAAAFAHAFGCAPRGGGKADLFAHFAGEVQNSLEDGRLARARPAGDNANLVRDCHRYGLPLYGVECELVLAFPVY